VSNFSVQRFM